MREWHYVVKGQKQGPVKENDLSTMLRNGQLPPETMVWTQGMEGWAQADRTQGLIPIALSPTPIPQYQTPDKISPNVETNIENSDAKSMFQEVNRISANEKGIRIQFGHWLGYEHEAYLTSEAELWAIPTKLPGKQKRFSSVICPYCGALLDVGFTQETFMILESEDVDKRSISYLRRRHLFRRMKFPMIVTVPHEKVPFYDHRKAFNLISHVYMLPRQFEDKGHAVLLPGGNELNEYTFGDLAFRYELDFANIVNMTSYSTSHMHVAQTSYTNPPKSYIGAFLNSNLKLVQSSGEGNLQKVNELLEHCNPNYESDMGLTPLISATKAGHKDVVIALLDSGADPDKCTKREQLPPLVIAALSGQLQIMSCLLEKGADPNVTCMLPGHSTPLVWSVLQGDLEGMQTLLASGADPTFALSGKLLLLAVSRGKPDVIKCLIDSWPRTQSANESMLDAKRYIVGPYRFDINSLFENQELPDSDSLNDQTR